MAYIPITISAVALLFSVYQFLNKSNKDTTTQITTMLVKLESIAEGIIEIKGDIRSMRDDLNDLRERMSKVEASSASAHKRIDTIEGKETRDERR